MCDVKREPLNIPGPPGRSSLRLSPVKGVRESIIVREQFKMARVECWASWLFIVVKKNNRIKDYV